MTGNMSFKGSTLKMSIIKVNCLVGLFFFWWEVITENIVTFAVPFVSGSMMVALQFTVSFCTIFLFFVSFFFSNK